MVLGSYRRDDFADPDSFRVQLGMVLGRYPDDIIRDVTSPITGIQRTCKFPPSIAEVVEFCDETKRRKTYANDWDDRSRKQVEERKQLEEHDAREPLEHRNQVAKRILAEYQAGIASKQPKRETPEEVKARLRISDAQWDAIPDQPIPDEWTPLQRAARNLEERYRRNEGAVAE